MGGLSCDGRISIHALLAESDSKPRRLKSRRCVFLSTLSLRRATPSIQVQHPLKSISIHALLAESDIQAMAHLTAHLISIHALLAESDFRGWLWPHSAAIFLSTLSLRRATACTGTATPPHLQFLSTLSLRRATCARCHCWGLNEFLSTLSLRRATGVLFLIDEIQLISIHALLAESDNRRPL